MYQNTEKNSDVNKYRDVALIRKKNNYLLILMVKMNLVLIDQSLKEFDEILEKNN